MLKKSFTKRNFMYIFACGEDVFDKKVVYSELYRI